jgi:REP element-mobilizing transposase RayT
MKIHNREKAMLHFGQSRRHKGHDYTATGYYFITIKTYRRRPVFGCIHEKVIMLNEHGQILLDEWRSIPHIWPFVRAEECAIMPDHFHGLLYMESHDAPSPTLPEFRIRAGSLGAIIAQFKSRVTKRIRALPLHEGFAVWQSNYDDRIIRDDRHLRNVRRYIRNNPACFK